MERQLPKALQTFVDPFPFRIFIDRNEGDWKMPFEWHEPLEVFYALSGRGSYFIEDKIYSFEEGDLFVIGNYELHKSQLIDNQPFEALVVMFHPSMACHFQLDDGFDPLALFYERPADFSHQLKTDAALRETLMLIFRRMMAECEGSQPYASRNIAALLQWLLVELYRAYIRDKPVYQAEAGSGLRLKDVVANVLEYINEHYHEDIKLSKLANSLGVSPSYLSREFKNGTGFSLVEFIASRRIRAARELLQNSDLQVTEIATSVGYNNVTHFHWMFKKLIGVSPGQYRKLSKVYNRKISFPVFRNESVSQRGKQ